MTKQFFPQHFRGDIGSNTNYPPQSFNESGSSAQTFEGFDDGQGDSGTIIFNTGSELGRVVVVETAGPLPLLLAPLSNVLRLPREWVLPLFEKMKNLKKKVLRR